MYERFYGLSRTPFAVTPDPAMLFMSKAHREALATIIYGVETRKGFLVCTGEVGTGKSTLIRAFFDQARADAVKLIYTFTPQVTPFEMARYICAELGLDDPESVFAAVPRLQLKLLEEFENGRTVVLMIDEAQLLPPETLEFLRLLSNFETDTEKLIQIVLVGQPEVDATLARRDMRQVAQRVALRARLAPLDLEESFDYIDHRLRVSGAAELAQVMSPSAAWLIAEAAGGIPRCINILADNALIAGFGAAQRPLGSRLTGGAVGAFLAKSGAPGPVQTPRFAAGWRAARLLRGALVREKGEPDSWVSVAPAAAPSPPAAVPAAVMRPAPAAPVRPVFDPAATAILPPAAATLAEPDRAGPDSAGIAAPAVEFGTPVSTVGIIVIEPVAAPLAADRQPQPIAAAPLEERTTGVTPAPSLPSPASGRGPGWRPAGAAVPVQRPAIIGFTQRAPAAGAPSGRPARWPALSRVRDGLQTPRPSSERAG
jgi:general secretion pathway protein A